MQSILTTLLVLKLDIFISFNDEHSKNIALIFFTLLVLKLDSFSCFNDEQ